MRRMRGKRRPIQPAPFQAKHERFRHVQEVRRARRGCHAGHDAGEAVTPAEMRGTTMLAYLYGFVASDPAQQPAHMLLELEHDGTSWRLRRLLASCTTCEAAIAAGRLFAPDEHEHYEMPAALFADRNMHGFRKEQPS